VRILICSEYVPLPPNNGARLVLRAVLKELQQRHDVRVLCLATPDEARRCDPATTRPVVVIRPRWSLPIGLVRSTLSGRPLRLDGIAAAMESPLREEIASFEPDVLLALSGGLASLRREVHGKPCVLVALDASYRNWQAQAKEEGTFRRPFVEKEAERVRRFEQREYVNFDRVVVVSENDRESLAAINDRMRLVVIPNGVDSDYFAPDSTEPDPRAVAFHGTMNFAPNVSAASYLVDSIWPLVLDEVPDARLVLVGRSPAPPVQALGERPSITVTGDVADVRPPLRKAAVYACPMVSGTGIKNKLLEAMALERACVVTPKALGGLSVEAGQELLVASEPREFAAALIRLMRDAECRRALGRAARKYVVAEHSWHQVGNAYETVCREVIAEREAAGRAALRPSQYGEVVDAQGR
jgi:glycosyltransferase involved in cell wall biosynthesis